MSVIVSVYNRLGAAVNVEVDERNESRKLTTGDKAKDDLMFWARGPADESMDEIAAQNAFYAVSPLLYAGLVLDHADAIEHQGGGVWFGTMKYVSPNNKQQTGQMLVAFDTAGKQQKITSSIATTSAYDNTGSITPNNKNAINATGDKVEGVEITIPEYKLTLTYYAPNDSVTDSYIGVLYALTGTVCNAMFFGMDEGECLFLGAKGSRRGRGDWELTFEFAGSPNATGLTVGDITGIAKKGWEYLWVRYQKSADTTNNVLIDKPLIVYIEQVYHETDLSTLGIGTNFPVFP